MMQPLPDDLDRSNLLSALNEAAGDLVNNLLQDVTPENLEKLASLLSHGAGLCLMLQMTPTFRFELLLRTADGAVQTLAEAALEPVLH